MEFSIVLVSLRGKKKKKKSTLVLLPLKENVGDSVFLCHKCQKPLRQLREDSLVCMKSFQSHRSHKLANYLIKGRCKILYTFKVYKAYSSLSLLFYL